MSSRPPINRGDKDSQGPAWGLKEQLARLRGKNGNNNSVRHGGAGEQGQDRAAAGGGPSKIRVSVTGPALTHKIEQVQRIAMVYVLVVRILCGEIVFEKMNQHSPHRDCTNKQHRCDRHHHMVNG